jgi:phospholipase D1/2
MYETIYKALVEAGLENEYEPQDYLNFFCLGNRELADNENISKTVKPTGQNTPQVFCFYFLSIKYT